MQKEDLLVWAKKSRVIKKLPFLSDLLPHIMKPAFILTPSLIDSALLKKGESRFGGLPDVPPNFIWPHVNQHPMLFISQINLFDIAKIEMDTPLPKSGWLYFFGNPKVLKDDYVGVKGVEMIKVIYIDSPLESLERTSCAVPPSFFRLDFQRIYTLPRNSWEHPALEEALEKQEDIYNAKAREAYQKTYDEQMALYEKLIKEENITPLSVHQWNALTSAERIRRREIEALRPPPMRFFPSDDQAETIYLKLMYQLEDKQLSYYKIEDNFRFLGYPSTIHNQPREQMEFLLGLNVTKKKIPFPKEWTWWEDLLFFIPQHDLKNACFENVEGEVEFS